MKKVVLLVAVIVLLSLSGLAQADVFNMGSGLTSLETVTVNNPGNAGETSGNGGWGGPIRYNTGRVDYFYKIGKYEVTAAQYCEFLNAVAKTDTYALYNPSMDGAAGLMGCNITQSGDNGSYVYAVAIGAENRPVNFVSWADSARFANWLHNGQSTAATVAEAYALTEDGAYTLNGATDTAALNTINRNGNWKWAVASEDEWHKAAYFDPSKSAPGIPGYWDFAMQSDMGVAPGTSFTGTNDANWQTDHPYPYSTDVGSFVNSPSHYGTFDQCGNVMEKTDTLSLMTNGTTLSRSTRGGSYWYSGEHYMYAVNRTFIDYPQDYENHLLGFRVVGLTNPDVTNMGPGLVSLDIVPVGNPGNPGETSGNAGWGGFIKANTGAVAYDYNIGKYEVTSAQYTVFLNAVAKTDTYGLYNTSMSVSGAEGPRIERAGVSGSYVYTVRNDDPYLFANRPVCYVSWGDTARFVNWLNNGQPVGAQDNTTTEDGVYTLNGKTSNEDLLTVTRKSGWKWALPSEDEWYKAAFHKNDGVTGNYWDFPMQSDSSIKPGRSYSGTNDANWVDYTAPYNGYLETYFNRSLVGSFINSPSPYGTFDQGGNVWERNETVIQLGYTGAGAMAFGLRGSCYRTTGEHIMYAVYRDPNYVPDFEWQGIGFRVVSAYSAPPVLATLIGSVNLLSFDGDKTAVTGTVEVGANSYPLVLDIDGNFTITDLAEGTYDVRIKASHWLARMTSGVAIAGDTIMFPVSLINGDVVDNNEVDFDDINATRAAYGSFPGDDNWNEMADVDGSGEVDFTDINIVRGNYGEIGD